MSVPAWIRDRPGKIVCIGINYYSHLLGRPVPERPELFFKPPSALIADGETIWIPPDARRVEAEGEIAVVIGRRAKDIAVDSALDIVRGYTCALDVTERNWHGSDRQWWRAKGCDTFCPLGSTLALSLPADAQLETRVNGELAQQGTLKEMIFGIAEILAFASRYFTWEEGDILLTGTPGKPPELSSGDTVQVSISGLDPLRCPVA